MIEIRRIWRHEGELDAVHLVLSAAAPEGQEQPQRHIKLKRSGNPAMYDFISEHVAAIPRDINPDSDPETKEG
jgi:hypothetical protein